MLIFRKIRWNPKLTNTISTLPYILYYLLKGLACQKKFDSARANTALSLIFWISSRKRIFLQNHFCLLIRGPGGLDSWNKKCQKISWHCHFHETILRFRGLVYKSVLKGARSWDFLDFFYFINWTHLQPLIIRLKWICFWNSFGEDICEKLDPAQCWPAQSQTLRRLTLRGVGNLNDPKSKIG